LPADGGADGAGSDCVATGFVATGSVATGFVATGSVATGVVAVGGAATNCGANERVTEDWVPAALMAERGVTTAGVVLGGVASGFVTTGFVGAGCGAWFAGSRVATGVRGGRPTGVGSDGRVLVPEADRTVALAAAPTESPPATSALPPAGSAVGGGAAALAGAAGVLSWTGCWSEVPEPLAALWSPEPLAGAWSPVRLAAAWSPVRLANPSDVVAAAILLCGPPGVRLESTTVLVPSTGPRVPVSDAELGLTRTGVAEAPSDAVVEAIVPARAEPAWTPEANTLAAAIRPKN